MMCGGFPRGIPHTDAGGHAVGTAEHQRALQLAPWEGWQEGGGVLTLSMVVWGPASSSGKRTIEITYNYIPDGIA